MSEAPKRTLPWPPTKEDLERLYVIERLSAAKIASAYGLSCRNEKVAESTILYRLRRNGIPRRDKAELARKVTVAMEDEWVRRYQTGESLKKIAGSIVDPVTVWNHLKARGVVLRDKVEAQIRAVTKYERKPFQGDRFERAYLIGLRYGDLHSVRHGRAIRVRVSTTHPAMAELFESLFSPYGHVHRYPREADLVGYEWTLECDLDDTFEFLLAKPSTSELETMDDRSFLAFLAGLFDAEGSVLLHKKGERYDPEVSIANSEEKLLSFLIIRLRRLGFSAYEYWSEQDEDRDGVAGQSRVGRISIFKFDEVQEFLRRVHFRHWEKVAKADLIMRLGFGKGIESQGVILEKWKVFTDSIHRERNGFIQAAASQISEVKKS